MPESFKDIQKYPDLDMTSVFEVPRGICPVIFCNNQEEALHFLAVMKRCYPKYCETWNFPDTRYERNADGMGYRIVRGSDCGRMQFANQGFYRQEIAEGEPYFIIPFTDLLAQSDFAESEMPLDVLMGV